MQLKSTHGGGGVPGGDDHIWRLGMGGNRTFPSTHWSLVAKAGGEDKEGMREALSHVLGLYMPALRAHLQSHRRLSPDMAEELVSGFVTDKVIERDLIGQADKKKGKFRNFLLKSLNRYVVGQLRFRDAKKRTLPGRPSSVENAVKTSGRRQRTDVFDRAWAKSLIAETLGRMKMECVASGKAAVWGIFEMRVLEPILHDAPISDYQTMALRFGFASPAQASNALVTAKRTFHRHLRAVIGEYALADEVDEEIAELKRVLAQEQSAT